ncbi:glycosyltransferase family 4 protein [Microbacterium thalli]|uniref:glycosyltransferase family 4 protein n=1 Tax=Microbacterium thalli TaxID=3027921 RepID=UPI0023671C77|nr:glycosyltransferase family 4 protein [Microbacterium thalli]MDD7930675.1 glycosyltransferase family 4 protein [Microbacterium thalli]
MSGLRKDVIAVIQPFVPGYRRPLFDAIDAELRLRGLRLEVWHDSPKGRVAARGNAASGEWSVPIRQRRVSLGRRNITYRGVLGEARRVRAVVAGLASTNIETYALALDPHVRLMLWGHGRNFTASNNTIDTRIEAWLARRSAHVLTYTDEGKSHVVAQGAPDDKVTVVVNATDTRRLRAERAAVTPQESEELRAAHGLKGRRVALFVGAFDEPKQLPFLFHAMDQVTAVHDDVTLVLAGAGPEASEVEQFVAARHYAQVVGRLEASELARFSTITDLLVMPGRVGLVAVDALGLGLPIVTTRYPWHAPEAAYLTDGVDSVWTEFEVTAYAEGVTELLGDAARLQSLRAGAEHSGASFSVESSAARFVAGILAGLES